MFQKEFRQLKAENKDLKIRCVNFKFSRYEN